MEITRVSIITGIQRTVFFPQICTYQYRQWQDGALIQNALPTLNDEQREFIMNGITPEEWDDVIGDEEE